MISIKETPGISTENQNQIDSNNASVSQPIRNKWTLYTINAQFTVSVFVGILFMSNSKDTYRKPHFDLILFLFLL